MSQDTLVAQTMTATTREYLDELVGDNQKTSTQNKPYIPYTQEYFSQFSITKKQDLIKLIKELNGITNGIPENISHKFHRNLPNVLIATIKKGMIKYAEFKKNKKEEYLNEEIPLDIKLSGYLSKCLQISYYKSRNESPLKEAYDLEFKIFEETKDNNYDIAARSLFIASEISRDRLNRKESEDNKNERIAWCKRWIYAKEKYAEFISKEKIKQITAYQSVAEGYYAMFGLTKDIDDLKKSYEYNVKATEVAKEIDKKRFAISKLFAAKDAQEISDLTQNRQKKSETIFWLHQSIKLHKEAIPIFHEDDDYLSELNCYFNLGNSLFKLFRETDNNDHLERAYEMHMNSANISEKNNREEEVYSIIHAINNAKILAQRYKTKTWENNTIKCCRRIVALSEKYPRINIRDLGLFKSYTIDAKNIYKRKSS